MGFGFRSPLLEHSFTHPHLSQNPHHCLTDAMFNQASYLKEFQKLALENPNIKPKSWSVSPREGMLNNCLTALVLPARPSGGPLLKITIAAQYADLHTLPPTPAGTPYPKVNSCTLPNQKIPTGFFGNLPEDPCTATVFLVLRHKP